MISKFERAAIGGYWLYITEASERYDIPLNIVLALGSRESRWGCLLSPPGPKGTGDFRHRRFPTQYRTGPLPPDGLGFGRGLMQVDYDWHEFARGDKWRFPRENILYGCQILAQYLRTISQRYTGRSLTGQEILMAALAGYNSGTDRALKAIREARRIDYYTTGQNYSTDVLKRGPDGFGSMDMRKPAYMHKPIVISSSEKSFVRWSQEETDIC